MEAMQNVVRLHRACNNAGLEEISSLTSANSSSIKEFLEEMDKESSSIFGDLQGTLSGYQGEMALFAKELRERFQDSIVHTKETSKFINGILEKLLEESNKLESDTIIAHEAQLQSIADFRKAYEEQAHLESEKLLADMTNLVTDHIRRQKELVELRLDGLRDDAAKNKSCLAMHTSSMGSITTDAKRKWQEFSMQAEDGTKDAADFSAAKHCRMEVLLKKCVTTVDTASMHWKRAQQSVNEMSSQHVSALEQLVRNVSDGNEQHDADIASARTVAEEDVARNSDEFLHNFESISEKERESVSGIMGVVEAHSSSIQNLREDYSGQATDVKVQIQSTFEQKYMDYEPSGLTPVRCELDVPSKGTIESLRALPMESLLEEFRENHPYEPPSNTKELKPSLIPRSPLIQIN
ncbi:hypothetical protein Scep_015206 [Stephania cephalantha]|uniref:Uncharacterized protein n=1 Tax=Stephania cephalantha TaxID=152367 RepID=A0AAP0J467_9MAGN